MCGASIPKAQNGRRCTISSKNSARTFSLRAGMAARRRFARDQSRHQFALRHLRETRAGAGAAGADARQPSRPYRHAAKPVVRFALHQFRRDHGAVLQPGFPQADVADVQREQIRLGPGLYLAAKIADWTRIAIVDAVSVRHTRPIGGPNYGACGDVERPAAGMRDLFVKYGLIRAAALHTRRDRKSGRRLSCYDVTARDLIDRIVIGYIPEFSKHPDLLMKLVRPNLDQLWKGALPPRRQRPFCGHPSARPGKSRHVAWSSAPPMRPIASLTAK